ncbi:hypothetical protein MettiDRAFT_2356 [Methanolobus tindarius DSM 2278]|uniref:Uncharacterized protein n=1 Tax=Methanolobus tindarius DSM 2278 TaxID=1090322 RepID=W9DQL2_METTI|nr:hypothetical protein [Methanolobus tindarius]ETA68869.1 hypothetical protein MettiDRAFT_2356 [Methanolobus tindarius DSM 2278]
MTEKPEDSRPFYTPANPGRGFTDAEWENAKKILDEHRKELLAISDD